MSETRVKYGEGVEFVCPVDQVFNSMVPCPIQAHCAHFEDNGKTGSRAPFWQCLSQQEHSWHCCYRVSAHEPVSIIGSHCLDITHCIHVKLPYSTP